MVIRRLIPAVALLLITTGCTEAASEVDTYSPAFEISSEQQAEVEDGVVDQSEYEAAFRRFESCLAAEGYELKIYGMRGAMVDYGIPDAAVSSGIEPQCYDQEFSVVDPMWQTANPVEQ